VAAANARRRDDLLAAAGIEDDHGAHAAITAVALVREVPAIEREARELRPSEPHRAPGRLDRPCVADQRRARTATRRLADLARPLDTFEAATAQSLEHKTVRGARPHGTAVTREPCATVVVAHHLDDTFGSRACVADQVALLERRRCAHRDRGHDGRGLRVRRQRADRTQRMLRWLALATHGDSSTRSTQQREHEQRDQPHEVHGSTRGQRLDTSAPSARSRTSRSA